MVHNKKLKLPHAVEKSCTLLFSRLFVDLEVCGVVKKNHY